MGRVINYVRRKPDSPCYTPDDYEKQVSNVHYACTQDDFQCDYGYERVTPDRAVNEDKSSDVCQLAKTPPRHKDPSASTLENCIGSYRITKGYRRVAGDMCIGGAMWDAEEVPCPAGVLSSHSARVVLILLVLVGVSLFLVTLVGRYDSIWDIFSWATVTGAMRWVLNKCTGSRRTDQYDLVGAKGGRVPTRADEDSSFLDDGDSDSGAQLMSNERRGRGGRSSSSSSSGGGGDDEAPPKDTTPTPSPFGTLQPVKKRPAMVPKIAPPQREGGDGNVV